MKLDHHRIASMTRFGLRCSCKDLISAPSALREQPEVNAFNYLMDTHKAHRAAASEQGLLLESAPPTGDA